MYIEERPRQETQISWGLLIWVFLFSGVPMILTGVYFAWALLQGTSSSSWDLFSILARWVGLTVAIALPVAAIVWFKLLWSHRNPEAKQKYDEYWKKLTAGRELPKRFSLRFLCAYIVCFVAIIPYGILVSLLGLVSSYIGLGGYFGSILFAYVTSRRVAYYVVFGIASARKKREISAAPGVPPPPPA